MPALFSRSLDGLIRQAGVGVVIGVGLVATGWYYYALPSYTRVGYQPEQPVPYSHQLHVGQMGFDCTYCHTAVFESPHANVPAAQTCMNCHNPEKANVKGASPLLQPARDSWKSGNPVHWKRVHKLPEYAYFNHAVHTNKGVSCVSCHGQVNEMAVVWHDKPLSMGFCLQCHNAPEKHLRPVEEVTNLTYAAPATAGQSAADAQLDQGNQLKASLAVNPPMNCQGCHR